MQEQMMVIQNREEWGTQGSDGLNLTSPLREVVGRPGGHVQWAARRVTAQKRGLETVESLSRSRWQ